MFRVSVDRNGIQNLETLATLLQSAPEKIQRANDRAGRIAKEKIEDNLKKRGRPGRFIDVSYKKYGPFGLKFTFDTSKGGRGGYRGGKGRRYSALWASRIFLNSEQGLTGRRAFTLPQVKVVTARNSEVTMRYRVSHTSGRWRKGDKFAGPLRIPAIGPFHFSAQSGMPRQRIQKTSVEIIRDELDKQYKKEFGKILGPK